MGVAQGKQEGTIPVPGHRADHQRGLFADPRVIARIVGKLREEVPEFAALVGARVEAALIGKGASDILVPVGPRKRPTIGQAWGAVHALMAHELVADCEPAVRVTEPVPTGDLQDILAEAATPRVERLRQLAPDHPVPEMRNLYSFEVPDSVDGKALMRRLELEQAIEFVEPQATRKLIKPVRGDKR